MQPLHAFALLSIGYSLAEALALALTHFRPIHYEGQAFSRGMGMLLLLTLAGLQTIHFAWLYAGLPWVTAIPYRVLLFAVAPAFFLFSQPLLRPPAATPTAKWRLLHALPVALSTGLPTPMALPMAFAVGVGYLAWLAHCVYALRHDRSRFQREIQLLGAVFAIGVGVAILGLLESGLPGTWFFALYAMAIGTAFFLVRLTLGLRPQLSEEISEAAQASYTVSTLAQVDCEATLTRMQELMQSERLYTDAALNLTGLAQRLGLSSHQLSELLNSRLGRGFSRYVREQRIVAARAMLIDEPNASVLSIGLAVGFTSQSNFYEAFREIEGLPPGQYRKQHPPRRTKS